MLFFFRRNVTSIIAAILVDTTGSIYVERDGNRVDLAKGDSIYEDDVIITGPETVANIKFLDDTISQLSPGTELRIADFNFAAGEESLVMNLVERAIRATSGKVVELNPMGFEVVTPTATLGIRGTEFLANADGTFALIFISAGKVMVITRASDGQSVFLTGPNQVVTIPGGEAAGTDLIVREYTPQEFNQILEKATDPGEILEEQSELPDSEEAIDEQSEMPVFSSFVVLIEEEAALDAATQEIVDALVDLGATVVETDVANENELVNENEPVDEQI